MAVAICQLVFAGWLLWLWCAAAGVGDQRSEQMTEQEQAWLEELYTGLEELHAEGMCGGSCPLCLADPAEETDGGVGTTNQGGGAGREAP